MQATEYHAPGNGSFCLNLLTAPRLHSTPFTLHPNGPAFTHKQAARFPQGCKCVPSPTRPLPQETLPAHPSLYSTSLGLSPHL